jgi:hypothetical protein
MVGSSSGVALGRRQGVKSWRRSSRHVHLHASQSIVGQRMQKSAMVTVLASIG